MGLSAQGPEVTAEAEARQDTRHRWEEDCEYLPEARAALRREHRNLHAAEVRSRHQRTDRDADQHHDGKLHAQREHRALHREEYHEIDGREQLNGGIVRTMRILAKPNEYSVRLSAWERYRNAESATELEPILREINQ